MHNKIKFRCTTKLNFDAQQNYISMHNKIIFRCTTKLYFDAQQNYISMHNKIIFRCTTKLYFDAQQNYISMHNKKLSVNIIGAWYWSPLTRPFAGRPGRAHYEFASGMFCPFCGELLQNTFKYCAFCGRELPPELTIENEGLANDEELVYTESGTCDELITRYFRLGFAYQNILLFLSNYHSIVISLRTLNSKLRLLGLRRKNADYDLDNVRNRIQQEIDGPDCSGGYRAVWHILQMEGNQVPRENVRALLKELDPEGVEERRAKTLRRRRYCTPGPNFVWHVDGYDKLKPYGFPVHGCIDGYSRKVLWFKLCKTNNDPAVVGQHLLGAIEKYGGCPTLLRSDNGTENVIMTGM